MRDISKVDSAVCNQTERSYLLELFRGPGFVVDLLYFPHLTHLTKNIRLTIFYLIDRQIKMSKLTSYSGEANDLLLTMDRSQVVMLHLTLYPSMDKVWMRIFFKSMKHLTSLLLCESQYSNGGNNVVWMVLSELNRLAQLTHIQVYHSSVLTDIDVTLLAAHCRHLTLLSITSDSKVCENIIFELMKKNKNLRQLELSHMPLISGAILPLLAEYCKSLEYLDLYISHQFDWAEVVNLLTECVHLQYLRVKRRTKDHKSCDLTLSNENNTSNAKVLTLAQIESDINFWSESDLFHLLSMVRGCDEVCIAYIQNLSPRCIEIISASNPQLKTLRIRNAPAISANDLISLINHCSLLDNLRLMGCWGANRSQLIEKTTTCNIAVSWSLWY